MAALLMGGFSSGITPSVSGCEADETGRENYLSRSFREQKRCSGPRGLRCLGTWSSCLQPYKGLLVLAGGLSVKLCRASRAALFLQAGRGDGVVRQIAQGSDAQPHGLGGRQLFEHLHPWEASLSVEQGLRAELKPTFIPSCLALHFNSLPHWRAGNDSA